MPFMTIIAVLATANSGTSATRVPVEASSPAPYAMSALFVAFQARDPLFPDALDMKGIDSVKELLGIVAGMNDDARTALLRATLHALNQRILNSSGKTKRWLEKKKKIVEGAMDTLGIPR